MGNTESSAPAHGPAMPRQTPGASAATTAHAQIEKKVQMLEKREKLLNARVAAMKREAQVAIKGKQKKRALMALKKKKMYEAEIDKLGAARLNLETMVLTLESAVVNKETLMAMKTAADATKAVHGALDIDTLDDMRDDIEDQMAIADEIGAAISNPIGGGLDDDELEDEWDALQADVAAETASALPSAPVAARPTADLGAIGAAAFRTAVADMPTAPSTPVATGGATAAELAELEQLQAMMA